MDCNSSLIRKKVTIMGNAKAGSKRYIKLEVLESCAKDGISSITDIRSRIMTAAAAMGRLDNVDREQSQYRVYYKV